MVRSGTVRYPGMPLYAVDAPSACYARASLNLTVENALHSRFCKAERKGTRVTVEVKNTTETYDSNKHPGDAYASKDTNSMAKEGEKSATTGLLGLGKLMSTCRANHSEEFMSGLTKTDGIESMKKNYSETVCKHLLTAP